MEIDQHSPAHLDGLTEEALDRLPVGVVRIDAEGTVLFYSRREAELTGRDPELALGRNFFRDIAPCTLVPEFYGRFRRGLLKGSLDATFEFVFDFGMHPARARIRMHDAERSGGYWIVVEALERLPLHQMDAAQARLYSRRQPAPGAERTQDWTNAPQARRVDFAQCEREPIATCGAIQTFGCLLVLEAQEARVIAASANTTRFLGQAPEAVLGAEIGTLFPAGDGGLCEAIRSLSESDDPLPLRGFRVPPQPGFTELPLHLQLTPWRNRLLLEIEPRLNMDGDMTKDCSEDRTLEQFDFGAFGTQLLGLDDVTDICARTVQFLRALTGFERVLAYRFEPNHDGVVIAESLAPDALPSLLGLRYPATDIPRQARALYARSPLRYAPNRSYTDIPLLSLDIPPADIDIGGAQLRAQSPVHRAYLEDMGVNGSMTVSLMSDHHLWGLLIFHHRRPHAVSVALRRRLTELAGLVAARIALLEERGRLEARERGIAMVNRLVGQVDISKPFPRGFHGHKSKLRQLFNADSVQIYQKNRHLLGDADTDLDADQTRELLAFLRGRGGGIWSTNCLSGEFEPAREYPDQLAGVIAAFVGPAEDYVLLIGRRRARQQVRWGSDPGATWATSDPAGAKDAPRHRFTTWTETRTHHAKPWSHAELGSAEALRSLTQEIIVASAAHFEVLALRDGLTGLPNRERFRELLAEAIQESKQTSEIFGVGLLDIDHFKTINDTLGHDKGDILLRAASERISESLPAPAAVARLGGDEFALLLPAGYDDALDAMPQRVVEAFREPIIVGEDCFAVTVSLGITLGHGGSSESDLLKQADMALYQAKDSGRNCVRAFDSDLQQRALARLEITREILGRDPHDAVEILLQPQVPIAARAHAPRFEVLARWRTADETLLLPGDFIESARQSGLMREVTETVIAKAIALLRRRLESTNGAPMILAVNVAPSDLEARWFTRNLVRQLDEAGVPRSHLELELNESMLMHMTPSVRESLRQITAAGIPIAIDNFGSSFSSMGHLRELSIATLKIDRNLVRAVANDQDRRLVAGIIAMAHAIGKTTIAEGVERATELELLRRLDCDWGQGFLWSRPLPPDEVLEGQWRSQPSP